MSGTAGDWVGYAAGVLLMLVGLMAAGAVLAARWWPDVMRWAARLRRRPAQPPPQWLFERDMLRDRVAALVADNARLRSERARYKRQRDDLRAELEDEQRNSITVIQLRPDG